MIWKGLVIVLFSTLFIHIHGQAQGVCKGPVVEKRLLADDVRYASPFYVVALPRTGRTEQMDNICYSYFENNGGQFFHIMSITFKDGSNMYYTYSKGDISDRMGLAEATALSASQCKFQDHTLVPVCNMTVFVLYRCFIEGMCSDIDIGVTPGVDVRVVLAASPQLKPECATELQKNLQDTTVLAGGDYIILPNRFKPQCITRYNNTYSIGYQRAAGTKEVTENDLSERFGAEGANDLGLTKGQSKPSQPPATTARPTQSIWTQQNIYPRYPQQSQPPTKTTYNYQGASLKPGTNSAPGTKTSVRPGYTAAPMGTQTTNQWVRGPSPWGQGVQSSTQTHYHMWPAHSSNTPMPTMTGQSNVFYHIHTWQNPPPGCCKCS